MSPGEQMIDLVHVDDVVEAFVLSAQRLVSGTVEGHERYAVSSGRPIKLRELVELFVRVTAGPLAIEWGGRPYRDREVMIPWNTGSPVPGWQPKVGLEEGIQADGTWRTGTFQMNILLIYPGLVEGFDSYDKRSNWFNHGIGIISSILKNDGHLVTYLDLRKLKGWEDVETQIRGIGFDIALISVATVDFEPAQKLAEIIKSKNPDLKIMVGGPHPTLMTGETSEVMAFDYIFTHEAEITLPALLHKLPDIPRIIKGEMPPDLDALPFVDRTLAPLGETPWFAGLERPYFSITASRGCLYKCTFCQPAERAIFGNKVRKRSVDNVLDELEYLSRHYGMRSFMIHDDCFTQYYSWVEEFCEKKAGRGLTQTFACQSRADIICNRPDLMQRLVEVGLSWVLDRL